MQLCTTMQRQKVAMGLAEYKNIIGTAASISSLGLILAPSLLCVKIWKRGTSEDMPFHPLIEGLARSILIFQQGIVMGILPMVITHSFGLVLHLIYIGVYIIFTKDKSGVGRTVARWASLLVPMIAYANYEDPELVEARFGTLVTVFMTSLLFYHLYLLKNVIATKNTKDLPVPILIAASIVTFLWTLYGVAINKPAIQIQTGFGFLVCTLELILCAIWPSKPSDPKKTN